MPHESALVALACEKYSTDGKLKARAQWRGAMAQCAAPVPSHLAPAKADSLARESGIPVETVTETRVRSPGHGLGAGDGAGLLQVSGYITPTSQFLSLQRKAPVQQQRAEVGSLRNLPGSNASGVADPYTFAVRASRTLTRTTSSGRKCSVTG
jgi:hypothetical protein